MPDPKRQYVTLAGTAEDPKPMRKALRYDNGVPGLEFSYVTPCLSCAEDLLGEPGPGCAECGYTGKHRAAYFAPLADLRREILRLPKGVVL